MTQPDSATWWPWFGSRPNRPMWASKTMWDAPRGRWWDGVPRDKWEHEMGK